MILLITMKRDKSEHAYINCITPFDIAHDIEDSMLRKINERATYLHSEMRPGLLVASSMIYEGWRVNFRSLPFNEDRVRNFLETYENCLHRQFSERPEQYVGDFHTTRARMREAILKSSFSKESEAFKDTCKKLKIKHTYKAIEAYLKGL